MGLHTYKELLDLGTNINRTSLTNQLRDLFVKSATHTSSTIEVQDKNQILINSSGANFVRKEVVFVGSAICSCVRDGKGKKGRTAAFGERSID